MNYISPFRIKDEQIEKLVIRHFLKFNLEYKEKPKAKEYIFNLDFEERKIKIFAEYFWKKYPSLYTLVLNQIANEAQKTAQTE